MTGMPQPKNNIMPEDTGRTDDSERGADIDSVYRPFMDEWEIVAIAAAFSLASGPVSVLEWGSGNSTVYFSSKLPSGSRWNSVEHNRDWALQVSRTIQQLALSNVQLHYVPNSGPFRDGIDDGDYTSFKEYILFPLQMQRRFDFVLVDGRARVECMLAGWEILNPGGVMMLHDAEREEYNPGIPQQAHQLRMTNPFLPGGRSVLFMARDADVLSELASRLDRLLPETLLLASNLAEISLARRSSRAMQLFAEALYAQGDAVAALSVLEQAVEIDPGDVQVLTALGRILGEIGQSEGALMAFQLALEASPGDRQVTLAAVQAALAADRQDLARGWIETFLQTSDDEPMRTLLWKLQGDAEVRKATVSHAALPDSEKELSQPWVDGLHACLFVNTYYPKFLESHYRARPEVAGASYQDQLDSLLAANFGDSDFYSSGLSQNGWMATDIIVNCESLQQAWAREQGSHSAGLGIAVEQIRSASPDVVYLQDLNLATLEFIAAIRPYTRLIVGQIASPVPPQAHLSGIDILISSFPHFVERFRAQGLTSYYQPLAFPVRVLDALPAAPRDIDISFVGGISPAHGKGLAFLEYLAANVDIDFWGYGRELLQPDSAILPRHHGEAWGMDMFGLLARSRITVNRHIDVAEHSANNMRLFEATGCGALLITDYKDNLADLFEIGREVVAYRTPEECVALIRYYRDHPDEAAAIAHAGQARTLRDYGYPLNMRETALNLARHLRYQTESARLPEVDPQGVSVGYSAIAGDAEHDSLTHGWQSADIPARQRALQQKELAALYRGRIPPVYNILAQALWPILHSGDRVLEIGCSSGAYHEILHYLLPLRFSYSGVDYSSAMVDMAQDYYPEADFLVADGAHLPYPDAAFDIVISAGVLLHVPNTGDHVAETLRVARNHVVLHRTPVVRAGSTRHYRKLAYGVETIELHLNENQLLMLLLGAGCKLIAAYEYHSDVAHDTYEVTYVFRK